MSDSVFFWEYETRIVPIDTVKPSPLNPPSRTEKKRLKRLADRIDECGLLQPVLVTRDYVVIDGHRRLEALRQMGCKTVSVLYPTKHRALSEGKLFQAINEQGVRNPVTGNEWLERCLRGGEAPDNYANAIALIKDVCGHSYLETMAAKRLSPLSTVETTKGLMRYCGVDYNDRDFMCRTIHWLVDGRRQNIGRRIIDSKNTMPLVKASVLFRAIMEGVDLEFTVTLQLAA